MGGGYPISVEMKPSGPQISEKGANISTINFLLHRSSRIHPIRYPFSDVFSLANQRSEVDWCMGWYGCWDGKLKVFSPC